jgi:hypothetical protein
MQGAKITAASSYLSCLGAGFIPPSNLSERVGIKPTPTDGVHLERYLHKLMRYVYLLSLAMYKTPQSTLRNPQSEFPII